MIAIVCTSLVVLVDYTQQKRGSAAQPDAGSGSTGSTANGAQVVVVGGATTAATAFNGYGPKPGIVITLVQSGCNNSSSSSSSSSSSASSVYGKDGGSGPGSSCMAGIEEQPLCLQVVYAYVWIEKKREERDIQKKRKQKRRTVSFAEMYLYFCGHLIYLSLPSFFFFPSASPPFLRYGVLLILQILAHIASKVILGECIVGPARRRTARLRRKKKNQFQARKSRTLIRQVRYWWRYSSDTVAIQ